MFLGNNHHFSYIIKVIILATGLCFLPYTAWAVAPEIVPTFESLGISWTPVSRGSSETARVQYRVQGSGSWNTAQALWYDSRNREYRGSIVNLNPGTDYEVKLSLSPNGETVSSLISTWSETFPVGTTVALPPVTNGTYTINQSGSPGAYRLYTYGNSGSAVVDAGRTRNYGVYITEGVHHVIVRGLTVTGALAHGIFIDAATHDIIIEDNDISDWGREFSGDTRQGTIDENFRFAIGSKDSNGQDDAGERLIIQRNTIHNPAGDSNTWVYGHPRGPQAIGFRNSPGNNVIRYNTIYSDADHMYNDIMGWGDNMVSGKTGFPGPNSDIYGNYMSHSWENAIEAEGSGENVRIWNNFIEDSFITFGLVVVDQGPMYIWRNISNRSRRLDTSDNSDAFPGYGRGFMFKVGTSGSLGGGMTYIYHNTILQEKAPGKIYDLGLGGFIKYTNSTAKNITAYNNIAHLSGLYNPSVPVHLNSFVNSCNIDIDYNLYNGKILKNCPSKPHESYGGIKATPTYDSATLFDPAENEFSQALAVGSPGYDDGKVLPNFNDGYEGAGPDLGAVEHGQTVIVFGVKVEKNEKLQCKALSNCFDGLGK